MLGSKIELLEKLPIFRGLSQKQLGAILALSSKAFFDAGELLIVKDEVGNTAYLIMTGTARCLHFPAQSPPAAGIGPGSLIGEIAMLVNTVHPLTIQAKDRVRAIAFQRQALTQAMEDDPAIARQISENLLARLRLFAHDLRRIDSFLAEAEGTGDTHAVRIASTPQISSRPRLPHLLPIPHEKARRSA